MNKKCFVKEASVLIVLVLMLSSVGALAVNTATQTATKISGSAVPLNGGSRGGGTDWWPMFHRDLSHSGYSSSKAPETCNVLWSFETDYYGESSPAVVDGKVYIGYRDGYLYCLDADKGNKIWSYSTGGWVDSSPAVAGGMVYFITQDGDLYCLNANNGTKIWRYKTEQDKPIVLSSPAVVDGKVYFGAGDRNLYCLDANTGEMIWGYHNTTQSVFSSPAVVDGKVYFGTIDDSNYENIYGYVYCLNAETGKEIWGFKTEGYGFDFDGSSPAVVDGKVYIGAGNYYTNSGCLYCLDANTGSEIWNSKPGGQVKSSPAVVDGKVYFGTDHGNNIYGYVYCLNAETGEKIWAYNRFLADISSSPAVADGKLYIGISSEFSGCYVSCLDADTGKLIWNYSTWYMASSSPAIADGKVYIDCSNELYCFNQVAPDIPSITGPTNGKSGTPINYEFVSADPNGYQISYYIEWGDGKNNTTDLYPSGQEVTVSHTWTEKGTYAVRAKAINTKGAESSWGTLQVTMPRDKTVNRPLLQFLQQHLNMFPILQELLQRLGL